MREITSQILRTQDRLKRKSNGLAHVFHILFQCLEEYMGRVYKVLCANEVWRLL